MRGTQRDERNRTHRIKRLSCEERNGGVEMLCRSCGSRMRRTRRLANSGGSLQAAFLVFFVAAAGAGVVAADAAQRIPGGRARREQRHRRIARSLALLPVFFREAVPGGQLL